MKPFSEACEQNKKPILEVLQAEFFNCNRVLEIGSGTGQHAVHFGQNLNQVIWQTSDRMENHAGIREWLADSENSNVLTPILLDVAQGPWPAETYHGVFSANTAHIMSWEQVRAMLHGINKVLEKDGVFCLYGPFNYGGAYTSDSNKRFDSWLKDRDPDSGIRDFEALDSLAEKHGWILKQDYEMPVNNRTLVWRKMK